MEVILLEAVPSLGSRGETVKVKPGFARNYLFPKKLAILATEANQRVFQEEEKLLKRRDHHAMVDAQERASKMVDVSVTIPVQAGDEDKLYGSVSSHDIANELKKQGYEIDRKQIVLEEPIKKLGVYNIPMKLHNEVSVSIKVWVVRE